MVPPVAFKGLSYLTKCHKKSSLAVALVGLISCCDCDFSYKLLCSIVGSANCCTIPTHRCDVVFGCYLGSLSGRSGSISQCTAGVKIVLDECCGPHPHVGVSVFLGNFLVHNSFLHHHRLHLFHQGACCEGCWFLPWCLPSSSTKEFCNYKSPSFQYGPWCSPC